MQSKFEIYLQRNKALHELTYPVYFQWWRKTTYTEQSKAEKDERKGKSPLTVGYKGTDEYLELKQSIQDRLSIVTVFKDRLNSLTDELKDKTQLHKMALCVIKRIFKNPDIKTFSHVNMRKAYQQRFMLCDCQEIIAD